MITKITVVTDGDNFGCNGNDEIDLGRSVTAYGVKLERALRQAYPGAEIVIREEHSLDRPYAESDFDDSEARYKEEREAEQDVRAIEERVFAAGKFWRVNRRRASKAKKVPTTAGPELASE